MFDDNHRIILTFLSHTLLIGTRRGHDSISKHVEGQIESSVSVIYDAPDCKIRKNRGISNFIIDL